MMRLSLSLLLAAALSSAGQQDQEADFYRLVTLATPPGVVLEVGGLQAMPDGRLYVATRFGDIWLVEDSLAEAPAQPRWTLFAQGLHEVLGLAWRDGWLFATQRGEVTRLQDLDGDGRADVVETYADGWGLTGDYHEYAFGSKFDAAGNMLVVLCLTGSFTSEAPYRGWCVEVQRGGRVVPFASGIRSPGGIGTNALGHFFYTDNQGPWNGTSGLKHLVRGKFMGHPGGNRWYDLPAVQAALGARPAEPRSGSRMVPEAERIPELVPTAILFPYNKMGQSASGLACDGTGGRFGPFAGQLFVGDQTHSTVMRVFLERVDGVYQGALFPFREGYGSGNLALEFAADGSLFVGGTDRGWGARGGKPFALQRTVWTGRTPFAVHEMRAMPDGFELRFTEPVDAATAASTGSYKLTTYTYLYRADYGSPEVDATTPTLREARVAPDGRSVRLVVDGLQPGHVHELLLPGIRSRAGVPLLHAQAYYTLNRIPRGR